MFKLHIPRAPIVLSTAALTLGSLALAVPAHAAGRTASDGQEISVAVPYGDLNLATRAGADTLRHRVQAAARQICGPEPSDRLGYGRIYDDCVRATVDRAYATLHGPEAVAQTRGAAHGG